MIYKSIYKSNYSNFPNKLGDNIILLIIDGEFNMTVETDIDEKYLENISTIEVQFEPFNKQSNYPPPLTKTSIYYGKRFM